jgi:hypothetical protein
MRTSILNLYQRIYLKYLWRTVIRKTHLQRRYDQLCMLVDGAPGLDRLYLYGELAEEFEIKFAGEPFHEKFVAALAHRISEKARVLYKNLIY